MKKVKGKYDQGTTGGKLRDYGHLSH